MKGAYGYVDAEGKQRIVKYTAGIEGFKVESDEAAPGQGGSAPASAPVARAVQTYSPPPRPQPQPQPQQVYRPPAPAPQPQQPQQVYRAPAPPANYGAQPLGGYTPVASPARYAPPQPQQQLPQAAPITYRAPSPLPNYSAAISAGAATPISPSASPIYARPATAAAPSQLPAYTATLAQRQPTLAQVRPAHVASLPRASSPSLGSLGSSFGGSALQEPQESTTWGPPVINKELLSYNIGITQG